MGNVQPSWEKTYEIIKNTHDDAYHAIDAAISFEEQEKPHEAVAKYKQGIFLIDKALSTTVVAPEKPDDTWEKACNIIKKMKKTRAEVAMRINSITSCPNFVTNEPTTSTADAPSDSAPLTYSDLAMALNDLPIEDEDVARSANIIYSHDNVQLYFILPDGSVSKTSEPKVLNIFLIPGSEKVSRRVFLQIEDWVYPLVPGVSPCYRTSYGAFILPDLESKTPGASIGLILPPDADASVYELLEDILHGIISDSATLPKVSKRMKRSAITTIAIPKTYSEMISEGFASGGRFIAQGLIVGAQKAGSLLSYGTPKLINYMSPATEDKKISPSLIKGFEIASNVSGVAANATGYVAQKFGEATHALGRYLAPHIKKQGTLLLTSGFDMPEDEASSKMYDVLTVAAGAVEGFTNIYRGLETSASILGNSLSNNTVSVVQHKYGPQAGTLANDTFNTVGNIINIGHNTKILSARGLAKNTAKQTGKAMVQVAAHTSFAGNGGTLTSNSLINGSAASTSSMS
ncbi:hypothetical protein FQA39_LY08764 [Lamprigera yunnana]|nr:hypothetical protein FQA39_LY08764 [Lamprigera yunnana]